MTSFCSNAAGSTTTSPLLGEKIRNARALVIGAYPPYGSVVGLYRWVSMPLSGLQVISLAANGLRIMNWARTTQDGPVITGQKDPVMHRKAAVRCSRPKAG